MDDWLYLLKEIDVSLGSARSAFKEVIAWSEISFQEMFLMTGGLCLIFVVLGFVASFLDYVFRRRPKIKARPKTGSSDVWEARFFWKEKLRQIPKDEVAARRKVERKLRKVS